MQGSKFVEVAEPDYRAASRTHPRGGLDEAIFQGPEFRFARSEVVQPSGSDFAFNQFIVVANGTNFARLVEIFGAVEDFHHRIQVFLPESR